MQTDQSTDSATATTRRTFLTRAALGGALVSAAAVVLPAVTSGTPAGAVGDRGTLKDPDFVAFATPLELAATLAYTRALQSNLLDVTWTARATEFRSHHQSIADTLVTLGDPNAPAPEADATIGKTWLDAVSAAKEQNPLLLALATIEDTLAATYLAAVGQLAEQSTAKTITQALAVEGQQAALLAVGGGTPIPAVTPATSSVTGAIAIVIPASTTTTSTTAAN